MEIVFYTIIAAIVLVMGWIVWAVIKEEKEDEK